MENSKLEIEVPEIKSIDKDNIFLVRKFYTAYLIAYLIMKEKQDLIGSSEEKIELKKAIQEKILKEKFIFISIEKIDEIASIILDIFNGVEIDHNDLIFMAVLEVSNMIIRNKEYKDNREIIFDNPQKKSYYNKKKNNIEEKNFYFWKQRYLNSEKKRGYKIIYCEDSIYLFKNSDRYILLNDNGNKNNDDIIYSKNNLCKNVLYFRPEFFKKTIDNKRNIEILIPERYYNYK